MTAQTAEAREAEFQQFLTDKEPYFQVVRDAGDLPWFEDPAKLARLGITSTGVDAQRELFVRKYQRPEPPKGLHTNLSAIRGDHV
jgi:hypothetical protein